MTSLQLDKDNRRRYPIKIVWSPYVDGRLVPLVFDHKIQLIAEFADFALYEVKNHLRSHAVTEENEQAYLSTIRPIGYALASFATFVAERRLTWRGISDRELGDYKLWELKRVLDKDGSRTTIETAQETVNTKLKILYRFYWWAQEERSLVSAHLGWPKAPIRSRLVDYMKAPETLSDSVQALRSVYPLLYQRTGARSKHRKGHYATDEELEALRDHYRAHSSSAGADRNVLIIDIIEERGWRAGTIWGLKVEQFSDALIRKAIETNEQEIIVVPAVQKNGRRTPFTIRLPLAMRINHFCSSTRKDMLDALKKDEKSAKGFIFLGETTGKKLSRDEISRIVAGGFKIVGAPAGSGAHSIRRKFGKEYAREVIEVRKRLGFSIDPADAVADIAEGLGHESLAAQAAYTAGKTDVYKTTVEEELRRKNSELRAKLAERERELALVKKKRSQGTDK